ncbi:MAG TPA: N-acetyltransferase [bacterium]|nr:N-acetyltransferase [bacterium]
MADAALVVRPARLTDVEKMQALISRYAERRLMLNRKLLELYSDIREYQVVARGDEILGTCALHIFWSDLAEIRALTVAEELQGRGYGGRLVDACIAEARHLGIRRVFALTYVGGFFQKIGFRDAAKSELPQKVWMECVRCPKFPNCDEQALVKDLD